MINGVERADSVPKSRQLPEALRLHARDAREQLYFQYLRRSRNPACRISMCSWRYAHGSRLLRELQ